MSLPPIESLTMYKLGYKTLDEIDEKVRGKFAKFNNGWAKIDETTRKIMVYKAVYEHFLGIRPYTSGYLTWNEVDDQLKTKLSPYKNKWSSYTKESRKKLVDRAIYECREVRRRNFEELSSAIRCNRKMRDVRNFVSDVGFSNMPVQTIDGEFWEMVKSALLVIIVCAIIALVWICNI